MPHPTLQFKHAYLAMRRAIEASVAQLGLTAAQFDLIQELLHDDGLEHGKLQARLSISSPTLTNILARMEAAGWVDRHADPHDGRVKRIYLSSRARALCKTPAFRAAGEQLVERMFAGFDAPERQGFLAATERIRINFHGD